MMINDYIYEASIHSGSEYRMNDLTKLFHLDSKFNILNYLELKETIPQQITIVYYQQSTWKGSLGMRLCSNGYYTLQLWFPNDTTRIVYNNSKTISNNTNFSFKEACLKINEIAIRYNNIENYR